MIIYAGIIYIVLSSIYTFSYVRYTWNSSNKLAAMGAILVVFLSIGLSIFAYLRT